MNILITYPTSNEPQNKRASTLTRLKLDSPHQRIALLGLESYVHENKVEEATKTLQCLFLTTLIFVLSAFLAPLSFGSQSQVTAT